MAIKVKTYDGRGNSKDEYFFNDIRAALEKYVKCRNEILRFWDNMPLWPTIWVESGGEYIRVHDYSFSDLTEENIRKYLDERIIDTDDLLGSLA